MDFALTFFFISTPGWVAFNIKDKFLCQEDTTGFCRLIKQMMDDGLLNVSTQHRYRHRLSLAGDPLHYIAIVGEKTSDVPLELAKQM